MFNFIKKKEEKNGLEKALELKLISEEDYFELKKKKCEEKLKELKERKKE